MLVLSADLQFTVKYVKEKQNIWHFYFLLRKLLIISLNLLLLLKHEKLKSVMFLWINNRLFVVI